MKEDFQHLNQKQKVMNRTFLVLVVIILGILLYLLFIIMRRENLISFSDMQIEKSDSSNFLEESQKVVWYKIITPVKNEAKGHFYFNTEGGIFDSTRISLVQTSVLINLLKERNVLYSPSSKSLILTVEIPPKDSLNF